MLLRFFLLVFFSVLLSSCTSVSTTSTSSATKNKGSDVSKPVLEPAPSPRPAPAPVASSPSSAKSLSAPSVRVAAKPSSSSSSSGLTKKPSRPSHIPQSGLLTAGEIDDNLNFKEFKRYAKRVKDKQNGNGNLAQYPSVIDKGVIHLQVVDTTGRGLSNVHLKIAGQTYYTRSDGHFYLYPGYEIPQLDSSKLTVTLLSNDSQRNRALKTTVINTRKTGVQKITLTGQQNTLPKGLDLMFVIDTTGSMQDELSYIKSELKSIINRVKRLHPETSIRYGLIVYRDVGDQYVVRHYKFQNSLSAMETLLKKQNANGGGDYPEALDAAVEKGVRADWGKGNRARLMFLIADAPAHINGVNKAFNAAKIAHQKGIRIYPLGASGVKDEAEYLMRHIALISNGRYQFLTDDSGVGNKHQEPNVACYVVTRLDQLVVRTISSELSGRRVEPSKAEMIRKVGKYDNGLCL
ncbi:hypothetical protein GCM10009133_08950 [Cocleimonas flava]|uniref:von Willebrand factor type A domain-containing protein n=1 Tax=Cocleimonas flava TaxID=634765 RepID=A0A4R1EZE1_9GAMM|nr:vWA domain-containing protein [Cocleimonas flava]TCJ87257.1 von Willebrand factor type A domain-containing protein [Cocleimonas flava]